MYKIWQNWDDFLYLYLGSLLLHQKPWRLRVFIKCKRIYKITQLSLSCILCIRKQAIHAFSCNWINLHGFIFSEWCKDECNWCHLISTHLSKYLCNLTQNTSIRLLQMTWRGATIMFISIKYTRVQSGSCIQSYIFWLKNVFVYEGAPELNGKHWLQYNITLL